MPGTEIPPENRPEPPNIVYLIRYGAGRWIGLIHDEANEEATHLAYKNLWPTSWTIKYQWKNQQPDEFTIPAQTSYSTIGIPPGQRKFVPITTGKGGYETELEKFSG